MEYTPNTNRNPPAKPRDRADGFRRLPNGSNSGAGDDTATVGGSARGRGRTLDSRASLIRWFVILEARYWTTLFLLAGAQPGLAQTQAGFVRAPVTPSFSPTVPLNLPPNQITHIKLIPRNRKKLIPANQRIEEPLYREGHAHLSEVPAVGIEHLVGCAHRVAVVPHPHPALVVHGDVFEIRTKLGEGLLVEVDGLVAVLTVLGDDDGDGVAGGGAEGHRR